MARSQTVTSKRANGAFSLIVHLTDAHSHAPLLPFFSISPLLSPTVCLAPGSTATHKAASHGNRMCLQVLVRYHADLESRDERGWAPLHAAAFHGHVNIITLLRQ